MELPQYTLHPTIKRMVIPRALGLLVMAPLFYIGVLINAKLLGIDIPAIITVLIVIVLLVMIGVQAILYYVHFQKYRYLFFTNRIDYEGKKPATFLYTNFTEVRLKQNLFDKIFNTGSIMLSKEFLIGPVANVTQIKAYLEQLVQYYNFSQQRFRMQQAQANMQKESAQMAGQSGPQAQSRQSTTQQGGGQQGTQQSVQQSTQQTDQQKVQQSSGQQGAQSQGQTTGTGTQQTQGGNI